MLSKKLLSGILLLPLVSILAIRLSADMPSAGATEALLPSASRGVGKQTKETKEKKRKTRFAKKDADQSLERLESDAKANDEQSTAESKDIYLNFENTNLSNFVNYMAEQRKINLLPDKGLDQVKVSLTIRTPLSISGAWNIFLTVLEMAGFSIVQVGDLYKVMPKDKKLVEPLPAYINVPAESLPDSDLTVRYVFFLQNVQSGNVQDLLESMLSDKHQCIPYQDVNGFIITDKCFNIKSAVKILQELDRMGSPETVTVMRLKRANAKDVQTLLSSLIRQPDNNPLARLLGKSTEGTTDYFPPGTKIVAEERTNSLILMGAPDPIKKIEDFIINHVDTELGGAASPLHIYELQYTDASQVMEILQEVTAPPDSGPSQLAAQFGAIRGGVKYFKQMKFSVDKDGNRLIVSCSDKQDWKLLKKILQDLDKPQPQVAIETLFVTVSADDIDQMGGALRNKKHGQIGKNVDFQAGTLGAMQTGQDGGSADTVSLLGNMLFNLVKQQGSTLLSFGKPTNIWAVFQMLKTKSDASIIAQPFITVANKTTGNISVGQIIRVVADQGGDGTRGYTDCNASTALEITPQINLDGIIKLKTTVNIDDFTSPDGTSRSTKNLVTNVTMADGQVLVLGGFISTSVSDSVQKVPLLGDIPILRWLFRSEKREISRNYVFIFMAPTIIKPRALPGVELYTKMKLHQATEDVEATVKTTNAPDPLFNWFFDPKKENYSHKVVDYANARYQPTTVDITHDPYYRSAVDDDEESLYQTGMPLVAADGSVKPREKAKKLSLDAPVSPVDITGKKEAPLAIVEDKKEKKTQEKREQVVASVAALPATMPTARAADILQAQAAEPMIKLVPEKTAASTTVPEVVDSHPAQDSVVQALRERVRQRAVHQPLETNDLSAQRKKLKDLMGQHSGGAADQVTAATDDLESKRATLKQLLGGQNGQVNPMQTAGSIVDEAKRNTLKEYLSQASQQAPAAESAS